MYRTKLGTGPKMVRLICPRFALTLMALMIFALPSYGQGTVYGIVQDASIGERLPGATVNVKGSTYGTITDINGKYSLDGLKSGEQILVYKFLGFVTHEIYVTVEDGALTEQNVLLEPDITSLEEIVVTGQVLGQAAAINQQINANTIVNVVSKDKIRELPDQNAAETVGRLPGISVQRDAGEGQKIVVRGLAPRFSSITINGQRIPSTDSQDRSVDLSMMSPDVLAGIEVFKSLTPDRDADAVGGTVNFVTRTASSTPEIQGSFQYGYNGLTEDWGQVRANTSFSRRFFNDKFGLILSGNYQKVDRGQDRLNIGYDRPGEINGEVNPKVNEVRLAQDIEDRFRYGGNLVMDYEFSPKHKITLNPIIQFTERERDEYSTSFNADGGSINYQYRYTQDVTRLFSAGLTGDHTIGSKLSVAWSASFSDTYRYRPDNFRMDFRDQFATGSPGIGKPAFVLVDEMLLTHDLDRTILRRFATNEDDVKTSNTSVQVDLSYPVRVSKQVSATIRGGAKVRIDDRSRDVNSFAPLPLDVGELSFLSPGDYARDGNDRVLMSNFIGPFDDSGYKISSFDFGVGRADTLVGQHLNRDEILDFQRKYADTAPRDPFADIRDYTATDRITSGYLMGTFNVGEMVTLVAGARAEHTYLDYSGKTGSAFAPDDGQDIEDLNNDTTRTRSYLEIFPQVNLKIQPTKWFDIRVAATKTINRPTFQNLVPWERQDNFEATIERGNFDLAHTIAWNYDLFLSFYNKIGLFTIGGFYKELTNIDFEATRRIQINENETFVLNEPTNAVGMATVKGVELDAQVNLNFLPTPFDGLIFSANATLLETTTQYPFLRTFENPFRIVLTEREAEMVGQPDLVWNVSVGYEKGGFTGRISAVYQGTARGDDLRERPDYDEFVVSTTRWDLTFKQKITENLKAYVNFNNITNQQEQSLFGTRLSRVQNFGTTADFGFQLSF